MLAGHPPFQGSSIQTILARHARDPVPPLGSARPGVSVAVESVVMKALAKLPADRFSSAAELSSALEMAENGVRAGPERRLLPRASTVARRKTAGDQEREQRGAGTD
jgi:serine/threonine-protein kinase